MVRDFAHGVIRVPLACVPFVFWAAVSAAEPVQALGAPESGSERAVEPHTTLLQLNVVGSSSDLDSLKQALGGEWLYSMRLRWSRLDHFEPEELLGSSQPQRPSEERTLFCWIDLRDREMAHLYFFDPIRDRYMVRELGLRHRWGAFEAQSAAQIIELSVSALMSDAEAGMTRRQAHQLIAAVQPAPAPEPEPLANPPLPIRGPRYGFDFVSSYGVRAYSRELLVATGPALSIGLARYWHAHVHRLELGAGYEFARSVRSEFIGARISSWPMRLRAEYLFPVAGSTRLLLGPALAVGLDWVHAVAQPGTTTFVSSALETRTDHVFLLAPGLVWSVVASKHVALRLAISLDVVPRPIEHAFTVDESREVLTRAWHLRPAAGLGFVLR